MSVMGDNRDWWYSDEWTPEFYPGENYAREYWDAVNADRLGDDLPSKSDLAYDAELDRGEA